MPGQQIVNPSQAFRTVSDYTTYKDADSKLLDYPRSVEEFIASEAIALYDWVAFVAATSTVVAKVEKADAADRVSLWIGVCINAPAAGSVALVVTEGIAICNIDDTGAIAAGDYAIKHATASGASGVLAFASADATTVAGTVLGTYLGTEIGATNTAPVWVHKI